MSRARNSVLRENHAKVTMGFRLDPRIEADLAKLAERMKAEAPNWTFDKSEIVEEALKTAIAKAHQELDARQREAAKGSAT